MECQGCAYTVLPVLQTGKERLKVGEHVAGELGGEEHYGSQLWPRCEPSYLTLCDMCRGVSISSKMAPFSLDPLRLASCRSQPDRSQFCREETARRDDERLRRGHFQFCCPAMTRATSCCCLTVFFSAFVCIFIFLVDDWCVFAYIARTPLF